MLRQTIFCNPRVCLVLDGCKIKAFAFVAHAGCIFASASCRLEATFLMGLQTAQELFHNCLLVLSREWMGMGVAGMIITSDYGSLPHSLLSTSKTVPQVSATLGVSKLRLENAMAPRKKPQHR